MYNYYQQQPSLQQNINRPPVFPGLKGHPVSSLEEVKATSIDFDGSIFYFPDIANKRIYTKTVGMDGVAMLNMYELKPLPTEPVAEEFVTRQEFDQALQRIAQLLEQNNVPPTNKEPSKSNYKEVF